MAGYTNGRSLEVTPTWAVAGFCFVLVSISIIIEHAIHSLEKWLTKRHKRALYEALEKIKSELMLLGFISLLLTAGQGTISKICVPKSVGSTWHPCSGKQEINLIHNYKNYNNDHQYDLISHQNHRSRLLLSRLSDSADHDDHLRRILAANSGDDDQCTAQGKVPLMSAYGIHQLHMFIFVLALFHVFYCVTTLAVARTKMRKWKSWEMETRTTDYEFSYDPERFRFTRDTTFGRRHLNFWSHYSVLLWTVCFFRQFFRSVPKVDYLTLRNGFVIAHLAPQRYNRFDFQQYINRSLEEDFKVVVGISPIIWFLAILFLLSNTHGLKSYMWLPFIPLVVILLIGTKLQVIITKMGIRIEERYGEVVRGMPLVQPDDDLFWFGRPRLILYLIHFVLFQNAFQLAYLVWTLYEFRPKSCFHSRLDDIIIRTSMGFLIQILCSYVTLPLYALVTQMGSTLKPTVFNDRVSNAIRNWHQSARRQVRQSHQVARTSPIHGTPLSPPLSPARLQLHKLGSPRVDPGPSQPRFERSGPRLGSPRADPGPSQPRLERSGPRLRSPRADPGPIQPRLVRSVSDSDTIQSMADFPTREFSFDKTAIVLND